MACTHRYGSGSRRVAPRTAWALGYLAVFAPGDFSSWACGAPTDTVGMILRITHSPTGMLQIHKSRESKQGCLKSSLRCRWEHRGWKECSGDGVGVDFEKCLHRATLFKDPEHRIFHFFGDHQNFEDFQNFGRSSKMIENRACPNLDAMSVPEGLVHSIRILEAPGVFLARRWRRC